MKILIGIVASALLVLGSPAVAKHGGSGGHSKGHHSGNSDGAKGGGNNGGNEGGHGDHADKGAKGDKEGANDKDMKDNPFAEILKQAIQKKPN